jgi:hypothetical protein
MILFLFFLKNTVVCVYARIAEKLLFKIFNNHHNHQFDVCVDVVKQTSNIKKDFNFIKKI